MALALAPASSSAVTRAACPPCAAQCSAVVPSAAGRSMSRGCERDPRPRGRDVARAHRDRRARRRRPPDGRSCAAAIASAERNTPARRAQPGARTGTGACLVIRTGRSCPCSRRSARRSAPNSRATVSHRLPTGVRGGSRRCRCPAPTCAARHQQRQRIAGVLVRIAHAAAVHQHRVVEQRAVAVGRGLQPIEEPPEQLDVIGVDARHLLDVLRVVAVVRHGVVLLGDADLGIGALTELAVGHEGEHARQVGLVGDGQQLVHRARGAPRTTSGMPIGSVIDGTSAAVRASARWIRRSISRRLSR